MYLNDRILGKGAARTLRERGLAPLLRIGTDTFTRADLADVRCFSFAAAANLSAILNRALAVKNLKDVWDHVSPDDLALPRLGAMSLAVLGAAFEVEKLGGPDPLGAWVARHLKGEAVTFLSIKHRHKDRRALARQRRKKGRT